MKKILTFIFLFFILSGNAFSETDCSQIKKLSKEYLACLTNKTKEKTSNLGFDASNIKEKKTLADWFKKKQ